MCSRRRNNGNSEAAEVHHLLSSLLLVLLSSPVLLSLGKAGSLTCSALILQFERNSSGPFLLLCNHKVHFMMTLYVITAAATQNKLSACDISSMTHQPK